MAGIILLFLVALAVWMLPDPGGFTQQFGAPSVIPPLGWIGAAAVTVGYAAYTLWALPVTRTLSRELSWFRMLAVPLALLSGVIEELFFRQWVMDALADRGTGLVLQIAASAVVFALVHVVWVAFARDWRILVSVFVSTFVLGVLLAGVYIASGRVVLAAVLAHIAINLVIEPGLLHHAVLQSRRGDDEEAMA